MIDLDAQIERLQAEATERWGDSWVVKSLQFADGDTQCYAIRSRGRNGDGNLVHDRLWLSEDGDTVVERVTLEWRELDHETIEA
jgi:hypothetical protein